VGKIPEQWRALPEDSVFWIAYRGLRGRPALALMSAIGIALAVGLAVSVPVFAQAVSRAIMEEELNDLYAQVGRSPLAVRFHLLPSAARPFTSRQSQEMAFHIAHAIETHVGIPVEWHQTSVESAGLMLRTARDGPYGPAGSVLGNVSVGFISGIEQHIDVVSGRLMSEIGADDVTDVWLYEEWAQELGLQTDEELVVQAIVNPQPISIRIAGTWRARDTRDSYWSAQVMGGMRTMLLVRPEDYEARIEPFLGGMPVGSVSWMIYPSEEHFVPELAERYVQGLDRVEMQVRQMMPDVRHDVSPRPILDAHLQRRRPLTILLFGFSVPIIGFLLYFLNLVSRILVDGERRVTAVMVSRGMGFDQVFKISLYEGLILLALGTPPGILLGLGAARLMGHSASFMRFVDRSPLQVSLTGLNLWLVLVTMAVSLVARLWPALGQSRWSVVDYVREAVRESPTSPWRNVHLDLLLILPTAYAYHQLQQHGTIAVLGWESSADIFRDPLLFLVPALFMLTVALLAARLFPFVMRLWDLAFSRYLGVVWCLTIRQLGRQGRQYVNSLLLIMVSLGVGVFMASMATSLDRWIEDRMIYPLGADVVFQVDESEQPIDGSGALLADPVTGVANPDTWLIPRESFLDIPGVVGVTWVGSYRAQISAGTSRRNGRYLVIDRLSFPSAAAFRPDFTEESLGELMNRMGQQPDGVLVSRRYLQETLLDVGDPITLHVSTDGTNNVEVNATIVGVYDYFPTVYEDELLTVVGNLDHLLTVSGGVATYNIWLRMDEWTVDTFELRRALSEVAPYTSHYQDVWTLVQQERDQKERVGVYGTLTLGFLASLALSGVGLLIQYHRSLQERLSRFATLRAIGLSRGQLVAQVQLEYLIVLAVGLAGGILIGLEASRLFIPFFRISTADGRLPLPPLLMLPDYDRVILMTITFGVAQILAQFGLIRKAIQAELFQVLRMGMVEQ
jgi:putative ABC transport system permease protein